jgi:hypothetical protein
LSSRTTNGLSFTASECLPTTITGNTSNPACPGAADVGLDKAYTQIIQNIRVKPGQPHDVSIVYAESPGRSSVAYLLDGKVVASVNNVGVPLEKQGSSYTGV